MVEAFHPPEMQECNSWYCVPIVEAFDPPEIQECNSCYCVPIVKLLIMQKWKNVTVGIVFQ